MLKSYPVERTRRILILFFNKKITDINDSWDGLLPCIINVISEDTEADLAGDVPIGPTMRSSNIISFSMNIYGLNARADKITENPWRGKKKPDLYSSLK